MSTHTTDVEVCTIADIGIEITGEDAPPMIEAINEYLSVFAKPVTRTSADFLTGRTDCLKCGRQLDGALGSFQWGLTHGEGNCSGCSWPCRAYHRPKHDGEEIFNRPLHIILQYHPSCVSTKGKS